MAKREKAAAAAAPDIASDVDETHDVTVDLDGADEEDGYAVTGPNDDDDDLWDADDETDEEASGAEEPDDAPPAGASSPALDERPIEAYLGKRTLAGLAHKMRDKPLHAQEDPWLLSTLGRVTDEVIATRNGAGTRLEAEIVADVAVLMAEAERRGADTKLSGGTRLFIAGLLDAAAESEEVEVPASVQEAFDAASDAMSRAFAADVDEPNPSIDEREASGRDTEIAGDSETTGSPLAERAPAGMPIGIADALPGKPVVTDLVVEIPVVEIQPDPDQPREAVDDELKGSIGTEGVRQPIVVRQNPRLSITGKLYMIVDGERRWTAAVAAGLETIPARVTAQADDEGERLLLQVTLNEGKRLAPMEEAKAWKRIMGAKGWTIQQLAAALGRAKSTVSDRLAMLDAPAPFQPLFLDGTLSAAAAPIVRRYRELPDSVLQELLANTKKFVWKDSIESGVAVPVDEVESGLVDELDQLGSLRLLENADVKTYPGQKARVGEDVYALDVNEFHAFQAAKQQATPASASSSTPAKRQPDPYAKQERERAKKAHALSDLRKLHAQTIAKKLPGQLDAKWGLFLVRHLVAEMTTDSQRFAVRILGFDPPKVGSSGFVFDKAIVKYAESLKAPELVQLALTLLLASDLYVSPNSTRQEAPRISEAAKLLKLDLSKVKAPDPDAPKAPTPAATPKAKRRAANVAFMQPMQPDAVLAGIVGDKAIPRTEVTKKLWAYIKKHKRQGNTNTADRRNIYADAKLLPVFGGKKKVSMFEMTKLINKHLKPVAPAKKGGRRS